MWYNPRLCQKQSLLFPLSRRTKGSLGSLLQALLQMRWNIHNIRLLWVAAILKGRQNYPTQFPCCSDWLCEYKNCHVYLSSYGSYRSLEWLKLFLSLESTTYLPSKLDYSYLTVTYASKSKSTTKFMIFDSSIMKYRVITYSIFKHREFNIF